MKEFIKRFTSRKFLLTIAGIFLVTQFPESQNQILALIAAYNGAEGAYDVVSAYAQKSAPQIQQLDTLHQLDDDYTNEIVGGDDI